MSSPSAVAEDIHRLTELQEAILIRRRRHPQDDAGLLQLTARLLGPLRDEWLSEAWQGTIARHPALRSSVHWRDLRHPVQVVAPAVELPIERLDTRESGQSGSALRRQLLADDRQRGLDLGRPPAMRLTLVRLADDEHLLLWTCHHLLLDGWSSALVLDEVMARYRAAAGGLPLEERAAPPFRDYVRWVRGGTPAKPGEFWSSGSVDDSSRPDVAEVLAAPLLTGPDWRGDATVDATAERTFDSLRAPVVEAWTRRHGLTASILFVGAWALVLAAATGSDRPVFGCVVSGRGAEIEGIDAMVGMLANALPIQPRVDPAARPSDWLVDLFREQQRAQGFEHLPLERLFRGGGVALRRPPFDTLLTYARFPAQAESVDNDGLRLVDYRGDLTTAYPLTLVIEPGEPFRVEAHYDSGRFDRRRVTELLGRLETGVAVLVADDAESLSELLERVPSAGPAAAAVVAAPRPLGGTGAVAAETPTQGQLMRIWNDLIDVQEYGVDDNFFELGGHSLLVPQLLVRIRQDFGAELPLGAVLQAPTIRELAAVIEADNEAEAADRSWPSLVAIREGGSERPLFIVHGLGGEVGWFYNLANYLDPELPLYGLQAPREPFSQLEAMAGHYLEAVRSLQPRGPYRLGGYCVGGGVAYDMACQLEAAGEEVEVLVLVDSVPQAYAGQSASASRGLAGRVMNLVRKPPREILASVRDELGRVLRRAGRRRASGPVELDDVLDMRTLPEVYHDASRKHFRAMRDYQPGCFGGTVRLFRTADERFGDDFGWGSLVAGDLVVERVPGRHVDVLKEPHVRVVGRRLSAALASARGTGG